MNLQSGLLQEDNMSLFADYYQFTMGFVNFKEKTHLKNITADYFVRSIPQGQYILTAGLEQVIQYILNIKFTEEDLSWLLTNTELKYEYLSYLEDFKFTGDILAMPEGTVAFPNQPIISITGSALEVEFLETYLLCIMNFQSLIATKASRVVYAAQNKPVFEFGARRAHGRDAAILAARAAFIGGSKRTSLVSASQKFNIPFVGTMAHKFILKYPSELEAFRAYVRTFPEHSTLLIDTYNTIQGAKNACIIADEMKKERKQLSGVRLDSGDLLVLSKEVRRILDLAGHHKVKIIATNELDEFRIRELLKRGAPIDAFGVGTKLVIGHHHYGDRQNSLSGVYKIVDCNGIPVGKESSDDPGKLTIAGKKQIYRFYDSASQYYNFDTVVPRNWENEKHPNEFPLLQTIVKDGELVYDFPSIIDVQKHAKMELMKLREFHLELDSNHKYKVHIDKSLFEKPNNE